MTEWKSAVKDMVDSIGQIRTGGKELRVKIKEEVARLRILRFELFCSYV